MRRFPRFSQALIGLPLLILLFSCAGPRKRPTAMEGTETVSWDGPFELPLHQPGPEDLDALLERLAAEPASMALRREAGILYQILSPPDRWDYLDQAIMHLTWVQERHASDPAALMFLGLAKAAKGKDPTVNPLAKLASAREGFRLMDQALALAPESFSLRLLRAKAQLLAPGILGRKQSLAEDYAWLSARLEPDPKPGLARHLAARGYIFLGDYQHRKAKDEAGARALWQRARDLGKGGYAEKVAISRLAGSPEAF